MSAPSGRGRALETATLAAILLLAFAALVHRAADPWQDATSWNGALWSLFARNFLRYGYRALHFGHAYISGPVPDTLGYYTHHSVLITVILTELYRLFGVHEAVARVAVSMVTVATAGLVYVLTRSLFDARAALAAAFVFACCPLTLFFGRMYNHEVFALFWIVACVTAYRRWLDTHAHRDLALVGAGAFAAAMTAWPGYYLWPALALHHRLAVGRGAEHRRLFRTLGTTALLSFGIYAAHGCWLKGSSLFAEIVAACRHGWFSDRLDWGETFTFWDFVKTELKRCRDLFTLPVAVLAPVGLAHVAWRAATRRGDHAPGLLLMLLVFGASHLLLFKQDTMGHDYYIYYLLPGVSIVAGVGAGTLLAPGAARTLRAAALVAAGVAFVILSARTTAALRADVIAERSFYVALGTWLNAHTDFSDRVLLNFAPEGPFVSFYADRDVAEGIDSLPTLRAARTAKSILVLRSGRTPHFERVMRRHYAVETVISNGEAVAVIYLPQARGLGAAG